MKSTFYRECSKQALSTGRCRGISGMPNRSLSAWGHWHPAGFSDSQPHGHCAGPFRSNAVSAATWDAQAGPRHWRVTVREGGLARPARRTPVDAWPPHAGSRASTHEGGRLGSSWLLVLGIQTHADHRQPRLLGQHPGKGQDPPRTPREAALSISLLGPLIEGYTSPRFP